MNSDVNKERHNKMNLLKPKFFAALFGGVLFCLGTMANAEPDMSEIKPLSAEPVMELKVLIAPGINIGESDKGSRRMIPITGGEFHGRDIKGEIIPGGADWQLTRPDGVLEVKAIYAIRTDDGQVIAVDNRGIVVRQEGAPPYIRTVPKFEAPKGKYDWLNKRVFLGTIQPSPKGDFVIIRVFEVQ